MHDFAGQILDADFVAAGKHHAPLQSVLQFAHIARPIVFLDRRHRLTLQPRVASQPRSMQLQETSCQQRNVFFVRPQRRQLDSHHAEPVEQILAKLSPANLRLQIAVRRADHPHIHGNRLRSAEPFDGAVLEYAQHFRLRHRIHVPNFIQKNRATGGQFELSFFLLCSTRECAPFVAY